MLVLAAYHCDKLTVTTHRGALDTELLGDTEVLRACCRAEWDGETEWRGRAGRFTPERNVGK